MDPHDLIMTVAYQSVERVRLLNRIADLEHEIDALRGRVNSMQTAKPEGADAQTSPPPEGTTDA